MTRHPSPLGGLPVPLRALHLTLALSVSWIAALGSNEATAQTVQNLQLKSVPPDLVPETADGELAVAPDLGQPTPLANSRPGNAGATPPRTGAAQAAAQGARSATSAARSTRVARANAPIGAGIERAVFERVPVRVALPVGRERLVTLPAPAALHVPNDMESVARIEVIDRTIYITALVPFVPIRIVAELVDDGTQIPLDLVAGSATAQASQELQVFLGGRGNAGSAPSSAAPATGEAGANAPAAAAASMVDLTRYAAQVLYAPRRLIQPAAAISQVPVPNKVIPGLLRGALVETAPLGQWRSGQLFVTAVRVTNLSTQPYEIALEQVRGRWLAATAQHGRIGPKGSESDTTSIYLVCDRSFEACL